MVWDPHSWGRGEVTALRESPSQTTRYGYAEIEGGTLGVIGSAADGLWQVGQSKICTDGLCYNTAHPSLRRVSTKAGGVWVLKHGIKRADPGRRLLLAAWRWPEGTGVCRSAVPRQPEGMGERSSTARTPP